MSNNLGLKDARVNPRGVSREWVAKGRQRSERWKPARGGVDDLEEEHGPRRVPGPVARLDGRGYSPTLGNSATRMLVHP
jgi:hypothetical protein